MQLSSKAVQEQLRRIKVLEGRFTYRLSMLCKTMDIQAAELLKDTPLTLTAYNILIVVETFEQISLSDISRFNVMDRAQVSRTATELEAKGLVTFAPDPTSKRKKLVRLSDEGRDLLAELLPRFEARRANLEEALGEDGMAALSFGMDRLQSALTD